MNRLLTLAEMAEKLNRTARTFKSHVVRYNIPHYQLGPSMMFDPQEVLRHLSAKPDEQQTKAKVIRFTRKKKGSNTFAERLGL